MASTARTRAVFQDCRAAGSGVMGHHLSLAALGIGGLLRPGVPTLGTTTCRMSPKIVTCAATSVERRAILFVASGMPSERSERVLNS